ncbi:hypothetical protein KGQ20_10165 [Catenulispora sp. NF23]|uniref:Uncharacterized protein n=1 Tax=Catenulispora pinistramenti TaxID=2705254 RepID=A0ABS5KQ45_9ACTN|nr:hypothetical protein [Catenulispora pinistramenti]MBS2533139.1 hypothetical protein [Catenulispora pinistramenti]MBS2548172.1 hypothetical protein [Catenulispora pinistramenti]
MTAGAGVEDAAWPELHEMLLRLAGHGPDDLLTRCRAWLAQERLPDVGKALTHVALAWGVRVSDADFDLLDMLLSAAGADRSVLGLIARSGPSGLMYGFAPTFALAQDCLSGRAEPSSFWPGDGGPDATAPEDEVCRAAVGSVAATPEAKALWRAWRFPASGSPWPVPRRVYVVEAGAGADLAGITHAVQQALEAVGETAPQVESYSAGAALPEYQRRARACGALLWSRTPDPGVRIADPFPGEDGETSDRPVLDKAEREQLSAYLWAGELVLETDESMADPLADPQALDRSERVPSSVRTDGYWAWSEAVARCLDRYGFSPEHDLVEHARAQGFVAAAVDGAAAYRALAALRNPGPDPSDMPA